MLHFTVLHTPVLIDTCCGNNSMSRYHHQQHQWWRQTRHERVCSRRRHSNSDRTSSVLLSCWCDELRRRSVNHHSEMLERSDERFQQSNTGTTSTLKFELHSTAMQIQTTFTDTSLSVDNTQFSALDVALNITQQRLQKNWLALAARQLSSEQTHHSSSKPLTERRNWLQTRAVAYYKIPCLVSCSCSSVLSCKSAHLVKLIIIRNLY